MNNVGRSSMIWISKLEMFSFGCNVVGDGLTNMSENKYMFKMPLTSKICVMETILFDLQLMTAGTQ